MERRDFRIVSDRNQGGITFKDRPAPQARHAAAARGSHYIMQSQKVDRRTKNPTKIGGVFRNVDAMASYFLSVDSL
jgi:hypothetical protein